MQIILCQVGHIKSSFKREGQIRSERPSQIYNNQYESDVIVSTQARKNKPDKRKG